MGGLLAYGITEEVPMTSLHGSLVMDENDKPLSNALITLEPAWQSDQEHVRNRFIETDESGKFSLRNLPAGDYRIDVSTNAHRVDQMFVQLREGQSAEMILRAKPVDPYFELYGSQHVYAPSETASFELKGFFRKPDKSLKLRAFKLDFQKVVAEGSLYNALAPLSRSSANVKDPSTLGSVYREWEIPIANIDAEGVFMEKLRTENFEEGLYWVQATAPEQKLSQGTWINITNIALIGKQVNGQNVSYVTDIVTGKPIPDAEIGFGSQGAYKVLGKTNPDGLLRSDLPKEGRRVLVAGSGKSRALVDYYRNGQSADGLRIVAYSDRPIYRPGDTVQFKGIMRKLTGSEYSVPPVGPVRLELLDDSDNVIGVSQTATSPMGTYSGEFQISKEAEPGYFSVRATHAGAEHRMGFSVAAYRKPTYTITVTPEKPSYVRGDRARFKVKTEYYFGGPVPNAKVNAYIYRDIAWWSEEEEAEWAEEYGYTPGGAVYGDFSESVETTTNDQGEAIIEFDTTAEGDPDSLEFDFRYYANVSVTDEGGKYFDGQGSVRVTRGAVDLSVQSDTYLAAPNTPLTFEIEAASKDETVGGRQVIVQYGTEYWDNETMAWFKPETQTVTLNAEGKGTLTLTPQRGGSYRVRAQTKDKRGNAITSSTYVWVDGQIEGNPGPYPKLTVKLDKRTYKAGETARAMVQTDKPGGTALVTLESDRIHMVRTIPLTKNVETFEFPVLADYVPNVEVCVAYVKDKQFSTAIRSMKLDLGRKKLNIEITPDREKYQPGDVASMIVKTTTDAGMPVPAEISVGVVDESIYALAEDTFDLAGALFPTKYNDVETQYSFPELYLDGGDKAPTSLAVRRLFKDTAYWAPTVQTDASGLATVQVPLPDNLTTWRATVRGVTNQTEAGQAVSKVLSSRDLMVRIEGPSFLVNGDRQTVRAVISNRTNADAQVRVQFEANNLAVEGNLQQQVSVPANGNGSVELILKPDKSGEGKLIAKAWIDGGATDGVEQVFNVRPRGALLNDRFAGDTRGGAGFKVTLRPDADTESGRLRISVSPTIASSMVQSLDDLIDFPYGCVEQTMSRFYPTVVLSSTMESVGLGKPRRAAEIPQMVSDGVARLSAMQNSSGSWGWWHYDEGDPGMTAYVLDGLYRAKAAGYRVPEAVVDRGLDWADTTLAKQIAAPSWTSTPEQRSWFWNTQTADRLYLAAATAQWGRKEKASAFLQTVRLDKATPAIASNYALAAQALGQDAKPAIASLSKMAKVTDSVANWDEQYWGVETTARALRSIVLVEPTNPLVPKVLRYLMEQKRGRSWFSTRDTAMVLIAYTQYLKATKEVINSEGDVTLRINGQDMGRITFTKGSLGGPDAAFEVPLKQLQSGENNVELIRANGVVYYGVDMRQTVPIASIPASDPGLKISRVYRRLETRRLEDGTRRLMPTEQTVTSVTPGDLIRVEITIESDKHREFVIVEDPIPPSCRITDREDLPSDERWSDWWSRSSFFDDRAAFFARSVSKGKSTISYTMRAEMVGKSTALPVTIYNMYDPDQRSLAPEISLEVK